ncbi:MAG: hypothetical protein M1828_007591 [Chrysothrix sp. TS-e1954]|nr:MAG: hypothetical protein M1828_007591 [Chrysothrix sp. TS-e1954]
MNVIDLPLDILLDTIRYLPARDLLSLCNTCKTLRSDDDLLYSARYWSDLARTTFRVPTQALVAADGRRWMRLYRRMLTQSEVYVWGNNDRGSSGIFRAPSPPLGTAEALTLPSKAWPRRTLEDVGLVADLQCGGWSTAVLNSKGEIWMNGIVDGQRFSGPSPPPPRKLQFPEGHQGPRTAVAQFSMGRSHALGLSDTGTIWTWCDVSRPAVYLRLLGQESGGEQNHFGIEPYPVAQVKAGWSRSSALIASVGIIVWIPIDIARRNVQRREEEAIPDGVDVAACRHEWIVPRTTSQSVTTLSALKSAGAVTSWILLAHFVLFVTDTGRAYACRYPTSPDDYPEPFELSTRAVNRGDMVTPASASDFISDVQGSHESFALLYRSGQVLTADQSYLSALTNYQEVQFTPMQPQTSQTATAPALRCIPALQNTSVIQLAFGDYHFHALHADGSITSYGRESRFCGSLGLGDGGVDIVRGIHSLGWRGDGGLVPQSQTTGRRVAFEDEKRWWMDWLRNGNKDREEAWPRIETMIDNEEERAAVSEWFEHRLRNWENDAVKTDPSVRREDDDDDGLPTYFALTVAAAGWHSGALMLVNHEKGNRVRQAYEIPPPDSTRNKEIGAMSEEAIDHSEEDIAGQSLWQSLWQRFQRAIGLEDTADADETADTSPTPPEPHPTRWVWEDETFPRLRLRNGEVMRGQVPVLDWECPAWKNVEEVVI